MVTGRCNFSCFFCHMEGYREGYDKSIELNLEEVEVLSEAARRLGIRAVKITGGEPTLRSDLADIVRVFREKIGYVSMTTNASLVHLHMPRLVEAGISHVNVSLHALSPSAFEAITGSKLYDRVISNIRLLRDYGVPVKINFVILKKYNRYDIEKVIDFAAEIGARVQFIELHPVGKAAARFKEYYLPRWRILEILESRIVEIKYRVGLHNRPLILLDNGVLVEIVGPVGNYLFCAGCTRIRVTYDFKLLPCLNWKGSPVEVRPRLRQAVSFEDKVEQVVEAIKEVNRLRRPYVLFPLKTPPFSTGKKWATMRLGTPKSDGRLVIPGDRRGHLQLLLSEWGKYTA